MRYSQARSFFSRTTLRALACTLPLLSYTSRMAHAEEPKTTASQNIPLRERLNVAARDVINELPGSKEKLVSAIEECLKSDDMKLYEDALTLTTYLEESKVDFLKGQLPSKSGLKRVSMLVRLGCFYGDLASLNELGKYLNSQDRELKLAAVRGLLFATPVKDPATERRLEELQLNAVKPALTSNDSDLIDQVFKEFLQRIFYHTDYHDEIADRIAGKVAKILGVERNQVVSLFGMLNNAMISTEDYIKFLNSRITFVRLQTLEYIHRFYENPSADVVSKIKQMAKNDVSEAVRDLASEVSSHEGKPIDNILETALDVLIKYSKGTQSTLVLFVAKDEQVQGMAISDVEEFLGKRQPDMKFVEFEIDAKDMSRISTKYDLAHVPALVLFRDGKKGGDVYFNELDLDIVSSLLERGSAKEDAAGNPNNE